MGRTDAVPRPPSWRQGLNGTYLTSVLGSRRSVSHPSPPPVRSFRSGPDANHQPPAIPETHRRRSPRRAGPRPPTATCARAPARCCWHAIPSTALGDTTSRGSRATPSAENMPRVGVFRSANTALRSIQGFEATLWMRKGSASPARGPCSSRTGHSGSASHFQMLTKLKTRVIQTLAAPTRKFVTRSTILHASIDRDRARLPDRRGI